MTAWIPKTRLGRLVAQKKLNMINDIFESRLQIKEPEIVDLLLPDLKEEVLNVRMVQRMTDSGRRVKFSVIVAVGNGDGYVGIGKGKGKELGVSIKKAIADAKCNLIETRRGCGSWECGCGLPHTLPVHVTGKAGSVRVDLKPAPRGLGLAVADVAKPILKLAGISDVIGFTKGHTKTTVSFAYAVFDALKQTSLVKIKPDIESKLKIVTGATGKSILTGDSELEKRRKT